METVEIQIFDIHELPENVRSNVIYNWRAGDDWYWWNEWENVLTAFFNHFANETLLGHYEWAEHHRSKISFSVSEELSEMKGIRLFKYLANNHGEFIKKWNEGQLTGFMGDCDILEPIADFMKRPSLYMTFEDLVRECFEAWSLAVQKDYEYWLSEESILEDISANDIKFTANGGVWH